MMQMCARLDDSLEKVCLHAQLKPAMLRIRLWHLIGIASLSQFAPIQMAEQPQLAPLNTEGQQLNSDTTPPL